MPCFQRVISAERDVLEMLQELFCRSFFQDAKLSFDFQLAPCGERSAKHNLLGTLGYVDKTAWTRDSAAKPAHVDIALFIAFGKTKTSAIKPAPQREVITYDKEIVRVGRIEVAILKDCLN